MSSARFAGRRVIVTGASSGIGWATALLFAAEGAIVLAVARRPERLQALALEAGNLPGGGHIEPAAQDVRDRPALRRLISAYAAAGGLDVLVNNAGVIHQQPLSEVSDADWDDTVATNLNAAFSAAQEAGHHMAAGGGGAIVNVASIDGFLAESPFGSYCASKEGVIMLTRCLAVELGPLGVRCNAVCPGMTVSEMTEGDLQPEFESAYLGRIPLRRLGAAAEQASVIAFLASEEASFVNGATVDVDGGQRAGFWYAAGDAPALRPSAR